MGLLLFDNEKKIKVVQTHAYYKINKKPLTEKKKITTFDN